MSKATPPNKWDYRMWSVAKLVASWSKDTDRKVGCVITTADYRIVSTGYNGYPKQFNDLDLTNKNEKTIHAEVNAILRLPAYVDDLRMYVYGGHPCVGCATVIMQTDITRLYCQDIEETSSWRNSMVLATELLSQLKSYTIFSV